MRCIAIGRGRDEPFDSPAGWPEAVTRLRLPQSPACGFPALGSSEVDLQYGDSLQLSVLRIPVDCTSGVRHK